MIKIPLNGYAMLSIVFFIVTSACKDEETVRVSEIRPVRLETTDSHQELIYDDSHRLSGLKLSSFYPHDVILETTYTFYYQESGRIDSSAVTSGYSFKYLYDGNKIVRTNEYLNSSLSQYHEIAYDGKNRLSAITSWQDVPEEGGWIPHAKTSYQYDGNDNLIQSMIYYFDTGERQHKILTTFLYSDYDNKPNAENVYNAISLNPQSQLTRNNPGKMIIKNMYGNTTSVDTYTYSYNKYGYPENRKTLRSFPNNGQTITYETAYIYEIR
jgi:hypothetical protein